MSEKYCSLKGALETGDAGTPENEGALKNFLCKAAVESNTFLLYCISFLKAELCNLLLSLPSARVSYIAVQITGLKGIKNVF